MTADEREQVVADRDRLREDLYALYERPVVEGAERRRAELVAVMERGLERLDALLGEPCERCGGSGFDGGGEPCGVCA